MGSTQAIHRTSRRAGNVIHQIVTGVEVTIGMIGGAIFQIVMAQALPSEPAEWANMSASVVLGGLAVYLATRTIPALQKEHRDIVAELTKNFRDELKDAREAHKADIAELRDQK